MKVRIFAVSITVLILTILILSGPVNAFTLKLTLSNPTPLIDEVINFVVSVNIGSGESLPVDELNLKIGSSIDCKFNPDGTPISGCNGLIILPMLDTTYSKYDNLTGDYFGTDYNWGYGYGYGKYTLSYKIIANASLIGYGTHTTLFEADIRGDKFSKTGKHLVIETPDTSLFIISPTVGEISSTNRILFDIKTNRTAEYIQYYDDENGPYELCSKCSSVYDYRNFLQGEHNITVEAIFNFGSNSESREVLVDSIKPRIVSIVPKKITPVNSAELAVIYNEQNVKQTTLFIGNTSKIITCPSGINQECVTDFDLTGYDGQDLSFWFKMEDIAGNVEESRKGTLVVDLNGIELIVNSPTNQVYNNGRIQLDLKTNEQALIEYNDNGFGFVRLCPLCESVSRLRKFAPGDHEVIFRATDKAGNSDEKIINFSIS